MLKVELHPKPKLSMFVHLKLSTLYVKHDIQSILKQFVWETEK